MLLVDQLSVGYPAPRGAVLSPVTTTLRTGQLVSVIGRNGAGKSTLMRSIAGLQPPLSGRVHLDTSDLHQLAAAERARRVAVVLTERATHTGLSVMDAVSLGRNPHTSWQGRERAADHEAIMQALALTGVAAFAARPLDSLSDGERQRVMLARALAQSPRLLLLDEITAFLDLPGRIEIMLLLRRYAHDRGALVLLSSHDLELALELSDHVWLIDAGAMVEGDAQRLADSGQIGRAFDTDILRFEPAQRRFVRRGGHEEPVPRVPARS